MLKSEITPRTEYAFREKRISTLPLQRVRVIEHIRRNKWKAEWIDPNPGLIDYVESVQLLVPWKAHKAFLKEEADAGHLRAYNFEHGYERDSPIDFAVGQVFESVGERVSCDKGVMSGAPEAIDRIRQRAGLPTWTRPIASYVDRDGTLHMPFDNALELARAFCMKEPSAVLVAVEGTEREWSRDAARGEDYIVPLLNQYRASWALIRQWAGHDAAIAQREAEIQKLERLVWDAVCALQKAGLDSEATRLRRAIEKR
jgi:hypothetical protein